jgi:hypothetical protein
VEKDKGKSVDVRIRPDTFDFILDSATPITMANMKHEAALPDPLTHPAKTCEAPNREQRRLFSWQR